MTIDAGKAAALLLLAPVLGMAPAPPVFNADDAGGVFDSHTYPHAIVGQIRVRRMEGNSTQEIRINGISQFVSSNMDLAKDFPEGGTAYIILTTARARYLKR